MCTRNNKIRMYIYTVVDSGDEASAPGGDTNV